MAPQLNYIAPSTITYQASTFYTRVKNCEQLAKITCQQMPQTGVTNTSVSTTVPADKSNPADTEHTYTY